MTATERIIKACEKIDTAAEMEAIDIYSQLDGFLMQRNKLAKDIQLMKVEDNIRFHKSEMENINQKIKDLLAL